DVRGEIRPYLDEVHWDINAESWYTQHNLRDKIAADPALQGRVYAGCAGNMNLDYAAASRAPAMVLYDINPLQTIFWHSLTTLMAEMPDNQTFAAALPDFAKGLYYKLAALYDPQELFNIHPPDDTRPYGNAEERESPFRGMSYRRFNEWVEDRKSAA